MDLKLRGKSAVVNGASQGIGFAIAHTLASEGADVLISARKVEDIERAAQRLRGETGATIRTVVGDIRMLEGCANILAAVEAHGGVDILVNNDGAPPIGEALEFDDLRWTRAVEQNLMSVVRMVRGVTPGMKRRGGGSIVNIAALSALQPIPKFGLSVATWAGVIGLAKTLSMELAPSNIRINTLCPGIVRTPRLDVPSVADSTEFQELLAAVPLRRMGEPGEIAAVAAFLASPMASYVTGTAIAVDGGSNKSLI